MGNTMEVKLKEDKPVLEVTEALVGEFKDYISMADHSMAGLAKCMDAMRDACEMLLRQMETDPKLLDTATGTDSENVNNQQLARHLLQMINACVSGHKYVVIESLSKLFNFVWDLGKSCTDTTENNPLVFLVDKYKSGSESVGAEDGMSYADLRLRSLQREIKILQDKNAAAERELNNLNEREDLYRKDIELLEKENKAQKEKIVDLAENLNSKVDVLNEITLQSDDNKEITDFKNEYKSLKKEYEQFRKDMIAAKGVTEDCLNRKEQKINELEQELHNLKIDTTPKMSSTVHEETPMEDFEGLHQEIDRLNQEIAALKSNTVLHGFEHTNWDYFNCIEKSIKSDLYQSLEREMAISNIKLKISPWLSTNCIRFPTDGIIIVPVFIIPYSKPKERLERALTNIKDYPNKVILMFYDVNRPRDCEEMKNPEFNNLGRIFKFGHCSQEQPITDINNKMFRDLLQFLKSKCQQERYLSR